MVVLFYLLQPRGILEELGPRRLAAGGSDMVRKDHSHARHTVTARRDSVSTQPVDSVEMGLPSAIDETSIARETCISAR